MTLMTTRLNSGPLCGVDLVKVGAASGMLWRSPTITLVGFGELRRVSVERPRGGVEAQSQLTALAGANELADAPGTGAVGFGAFPFDRDRPGEMLIPEILLGANGHERWLIAPDGIGPADVSSIVDELGGRSKPASPPKVTLRSGRAASDWRDNVVGVTSERIRNGSLRKAVMARELTLIADEPFSIAQTACGLANRFPEAMVFAIDRFVGASPELLVARTNRVVNAHPLAGTAARSNDPEVDARLAAELFDSTKNRDEHRITIDWLLAELLPFCSYVDAEPEPSVLTLANVHHLATLVEGLLSKPPASILDLVAAVHPTPAVGGDPQASALELIAELEGFDRGRYAGPAGWVDSFGNGAFAVSIRSAQFDGSEARVCAGVGVVAESDPVAELAETQAKFRALLGTLLAPR